MAIITYFAYQLSFKQAIGAFRLHSQLQLEQFQVDDADGSLQQLSKKNSFYLDVLKGYRIKPSEDESRLWHSISGMAIRKGVQITFNPSPQPLGDTVLSTQQIVHRQFIFKGSYFNIIKLLDTISISKGLGRISTLKLTADTENERKNQLHMELSLAGVVR